MAQVYVLPNDECVLLTGVHHIAVDLWSLVILVQDFATRYTSLCKDDAQAVVCLCLFRFGKNLWWLLVSSTSDVFRDNGCAHTN